MVGKDAAEFRELESALREASAASPGLVVSAYLFGSEAEGRGHAESDIDIGILLSREAAPHARERLGR
jgi:predicted nucleotidyltransferase